LAQAILAQDLARRGLGFGAHEMAHSLFAGGMDAAAAIDNAISSSAALHRFAARLGYAMRGAKADAVDEHFIEPIFDALRRVADTLHPRGGKMPVAAGLHLARPEVREITQMLACIAGGGTCAGGDGLGKGTRKGEGKGKSKGKSYHCYKGGGNAAEENGEKGKGKGKKGKGLLDSGAVNDGNGEVAARSSGEEEAELAAEEAIGNKPPEAEAGLATATEEGGSQPHDPRGGSGLLEQHRAADSEEDGYSSGIGSGDDGLVSGDEAEELMAAYAVNYQRLYRKFRAEGYDDKQAARCAGLGCDEIAEAAAQGLRDG